MLFSSSEKKKKQKKRKKKKKENKEAAKETFSKKDIDKIKIKISAGISFTVSTHKLKISNYQKVINIAA